MSQNAFIARYRGWSIEHTWNEEFQRWDQVATQGSTRLESGEMNWYQFTVAMDRADGRPIFEDFIERIAPERKDWPWTSKAVTAPASEEVEDEDIAEEEEGFQAVPEREAQVDWKPGERKIWDWNGVLSERDLRALSRLGLPLERQSLISKPRPVAEFNDYEARCCAFNGEVCLEIGMAVYGDALGIYHVGFTHPSSMVAGGRVGSCMPGALLRRAVKAILADHQAPEPLPLEAPQAAVPGQWVQQPLFELMEA